ncbi:hypothetical protein MPDQ_000624 [Monascus purpureus]|uniref:DDHD domain-containing protein n=1 Tax=Monascus purpureus TaxID=5098 RepID=A0A507QPG4_MONPU|nr:hypothetical protein MPDQ_000624 [Monascus purpureus]
MTGPIHTYGPTCLLSDGELDLSALQSSPTPPRLRAQFFYASSLSIDDPLSPIPPPSGSRFENEKIPPQPFSAKDNAALEEAWQAIRQARLASLSRRPSTRGLIPVTEDRHGSGPMAIQEIDQGRILGHRKREGSPVDLSSGSTKRIASPPSEAGCTALEAAESVSVRDNRSRGVSISGSPFIRAPVDQFHSPSRLSMASDLSMDVGQELRPESRDAGGGHPVPKCSSLGANLAQPEESTDSLPVSVEDNEDQTLIPVGASRLHLVELPKLKMKPIYWNPLQDVCSVLRATWFYKNTMLPVEPELANKLEGGYLYFKPWTETWQDELNSCVENGADAELKIVHRLWPKEDPKSVSRPTTSQDQKASPRSHKPVSNIGTDSQMPEENKAAGGSIAAVKPFLNSSAIYVDAQNAQILRPSLLPSVSRGRRPLSAIRKGRQIGIPVVRGFSRKLWDRLHPSNPSPIDVRHYLRRTQTRDIPAAARGEICYACAIEASRPNPTDLVLVIHGIGQKLSERMESFHFTHAINALRRTVNMELNNEPVWTHVHQDHGGIMVLPVNWRSTLSLEDSTLESPSDEDPTTNHFTLKDITPETIPAVRTLISDVMLDIPYYLSHHKPKMIRAVTKEANRVYRLWCQNNPGFQEHGNVHIIAHSLGSVMALDILSNQPTKVPRFDFSNVEVHGDIFEFDTKNLFLCGSPAGFFLLLNKANLIPRRGINKPDSDSDERPRGLAGEAGTYGCLAVHNLYNIMHTTDPIAYRVNAAVDSDLADSLKMAAIPSSSASIWSSFGNVFRWNIPSAYEPSSTHRIAVAKLPSNVELETHDFTREEIAEKRMLLLNDNGQVDYFLSGGSGPLNIQYLNMLNAHSSYWILPDFVRFFVIEIARKQGKDGTLLALRAEKKKGWKR